MELEKSSMALREISVLKFSKMTPQQMYELSALRDRMENILRQGVLRPNGYFKLSNSFLSTVFSAVIGYILILLGYREKELEKLVQSGFCNVTSNLTENTI